MENVPFVPATLLCAINALLLSTSVTISVPPVVSGAFVSPMVTAAVETVAGSLLPLIVIWTVVVVPSAEATANVSDMDSPSFR